MTDIVWYSLKPSNDTSVDLPPALFEIGCSTSKIAMTQTKSIASYYLLLCLGAVLRGEMVCVTTRP